LCWWIFRRKKAQAAPPQPTPGICPGCERAVSADANFCPDCGTHLQRKEQAAPSPTPQPVVIPPPIMIPVPVPRPPAPAPTSHESPTLAPPIVPDAISKAIFEIREHLTQIDLDFIEKKMDEAFHSAQRAISESRIRDLDDVAQDAIKHLQEALNRPDLTLPERNRINADLQNLASRIPPIDTGELLKKQQDILSALSKVDTSVKAGEISQQMGKAASENMEKILEAIGEALKKRR